MCAARHGIRANASTDADPENGVRCRHSAGDRTEPDDCPGGNEHSARRDIAPADHRLSPTPARARGFPGGTTQPQNQFALTASASMPILAASRWAQVNQARDVVDVSL